MVDLTIMSIRAGAPASQSVDAMLSAAVEGANLHDPLGEGNSYTTASPEHPMHRDVCVSIKASLNDLCLQKGKGKWEPSQEALRHIFQARKFTSLDGSTENSGDLKAVVLHNLEVKHTKSTFPVALGTRVSAVDDCTFSAIGEAFSTVVLPRSENATVRTLQADDVSLCYEFSKKFPVSAMSKPLCTVPKTISDADLRLHVSRATRVTTSRRRASTRSRSGVLCLLQPTTPSSRRSRRTRTSCRWARSAW